MRDFKTFFKKFEKYCKIVWIFVKGVLYFICQLGMLTLFIWLFPRRNGLIYICGIFGCLSFSARCHLDLKGFLYEQ